MPFEAAAPAPVIGAPPAHPLGPVPGSAAPSCRTT